jgi:polyhydroxybutyrate depolymerase
VLLAALAAPASALRPGDHAISLGGAVDSRAYILHVPAKLEGKPALVLNFHGGGGNAAAHQKYVRMDAVADREGFVVAYPEGTGPLEGALQTWNAGGCCGSAVRDNVDDVGFVRRLLADIARRQDYDPARVYATGLSNGAMLSYRLAAELSDRIAAIAPVAGAIKVEHFFTARAVPVLHIHSVDDPRANYAGGLGPPLFGIAGTRVNHLAVETGLAEWAKASGCATPMEQREKKEWQGHTATLFAYPRCRADVQLWKLTGAGHVWPGGELDYLPKLLGPGTAVIDANTEMWRFFSRHRLPQQKN